MRRVLRKVANDERDLGDISTLADTCVVEQLFQNRCCAVWQLCWSIFTGTTRTAAAGQRPLWENQGKKRETGKARSSLSPEKHDRYVAASVFKFVYWLKRFTSIQLVDISYFCRSNNSSLMIFNKSKRVDLQAIQVQIQSSGMETRANPVTVSGNPSLFMRKRQTLLLFQCFGW